MSTSLPDRRWLVALAGTALQLCLGTVYAWSYFQKPLAATYAWNGTAVTGVFSLAIACLGLSAAAGGLLLPRVGPRRLVIGAGLLFGCGHLVAAAALAWRMLPLLYFGYGVLGGIGLGLGYVTPVATVAKWFPDRKGLATGMVIMGFGFGALLMSKAFAPLLYSWSGGNLVSVFAWLGVGFLIAVPATAMWLRNPSLSAEADDRPLVSDVASSELSELVSRRFAIMWVVFFCNILAGVSLISMQSPLLQELWQRRQPELDATALAASGATLIGGSSLFNGIGRMLWGGLSDRIGRVAAFRWMLASQAVAFVALYAVGDPWLFSGLVCYVMLCYGGGFGTMPSFVLDVFGPVRMPIAYGAILTAWSAAGIVGPLCMAALNDRRAFGLSGGVLCVGLVATCFLAVRPAGGPSIHSKAIQHED